MTFNVFMKLELDNRPLVTSPHHRMGIKTDVLGLRSPPDIPGLMMSMLM